jgi:hypothetical protein
MAVLLVAAFLLVEAPAPVAARTDLANGHWINTGAPSGIAAFPIVYDSAQNVLYAGMNERGVWKYDGKSWTDTGWKVAGYTVRCMAYDSHDNCVYAGSYDYDTDEGCGVWKCDGKKWSNTGGLISGELAESLAYDQNHDLLYAGTRELGVWKYDGTTWIDTGGTPSGCRVDSMAYDTVHDLLYAYVYGSKNLGVWKYDGANWTDTKSSYSNSDHQLAYDTVHGLLYDACENISDEVWTYDGKSWDETAPWDPSYAIGSIACDPVSGLVYVGCYDDAVASPVKGGVWVYDGTSWANTGGAVANFDMASLACDPVHGLLYAGSRDFEGGGVWVYGDGVISTFYFAEGSCRPGFEPYFCIQNPGGADADVTLTYMKGDGTTAEDRVIVPRYSRATVSPRNRLGTGDDAAHDFSTRVVCTNGKQVIVERPQYFNYGGAWTGGSNAMGAITTSTRYYFAEGTTRPDFETYFCILNPTGLPADVLLEYMMGDLGGESEHVEVPPYSRVTVRPRDKLGTGDDAAHDFSTEVSSKQQIVVERPEYFDFKGAWTGGHDVVGATYAAPSFYFAEGTTRPGFETYLCLQNPRKRGETPTIPDAEVTLTYMRTDGSSAQQKVSIPPVSRATVRPADVLMADGSGECDFSTRVDCTNGQLIVAERPEYFDYNKAWTGGHDVIGVTSPASTFCFAEGTTRDNFETYFCIQNPDTSDAAVTLTYMRTDGSSAQQVVNVCSKSRVTVRPADVLSTGDPKGGDFSTTVTCTNGQRIIVERPEYFNFDGEWTGGHDAVGFVPPGSNK